MTAIREAVILMAGSGSRLRGSDATFLKPLAPILGRPLVCYIIDALIEARINKINFIVGYQSERLRAAIEKLAPPKHEWVFIENPQWQKQNGISLLAAVNQVSAPFLLTMSDHLFDNAIVDLLIESADVDLLNLAVDRKIGSVFDLDDAMKIKTHGDKVAAIGKNLLDYDAIDTGLFVCPEAIFDYLERAKSGSCRNDCALADGVRLMAADAKVRAIDIGGAWWQDVDTPEMLACAETQLRSRLARRDLDMAHAGSDRGNRAENQTRASNNDPEMQDPVSQAE
jgi:1L-myo-inositol 1-phosphate cytidylyltransferase